ncbi:MAG: chemotaxis protein [Gammaproteobacteria bacterium]|nr:chemotaxis protein [Gammaproteobacteria bacterium]
MADYLLAVLVIGLVLAGWIGVQQLARSFAARHPEFGPAREEGSGCGSGCLCSGETACSRHTDGRLP